MAAAEASRIREDFRYCERLARTHYENFSVLSVFIPAQLRPHFAAIYAFCRGVDDLGDEFPGDRREALQGWREELIRAYQGRAEQPAFRALERTVEEFQLPFEEFDRLIRANEMDQQAKDYQTVEEVMDYCRHSANPVGRLVLGLFGIRDEERWRLSDATCTALQLANFLQDTAGDLKRGRNYWPEEELAQFGLSRRALAQAAGVGGTLDSEAISAFGRYQADRIQRLFQRGARLEHMVPKRLGLQLKLYRLGGQAVVEALRRQAFNPFLGRPVVTVGQKLSIMGAVAAGGLWH
ncbi:squalene synthase HpnC [Sulfobacillus harzensis]|uniref:Squalene synthase HpnC n=1 Tax=Sulfobacillus harzensis TaxID=2729629 RepID=A0A7Y0L2B3_9FIRM|nr:squalene synthase HpnC [Sulfobacillus harzensis]NMP21075.1 squalene synthase HpnC [Sulfobacillus harzensis]